MDTIYDKRSQKNSDEGSIWHVNEMAYSGCRATFFLLSRASVLHLIPVFNGLALGLTSAAGRKLAAAGGSCGVACWVALIHVWHCEILWTLGLKHILGGWGHLHATLNWVRTNMWFWAVVTGDTFLHGSVNSNLKMLGGTRWQEKWKNVAASD